MADLNDVHRIALALPGVTEGPEGLSYSVPVKGKEKGFIWAWNERVEPKKARVPNRGVLVVLVPNLQIKEMLLQSDEVKFFTEQHYNGFPAVFVRLSEIDKEELKEMIIEAWRCKATRDLLAQLPD
jgi:hypothetical protein